MKVPLRNASCRKWLFACLVTASMGVHAKCWVDARVSNLAQQTANQYFPNVAAQMPRVVVCSGNTFPPRYGGEFQSGPYMIRIPDWLLDRSDLGNTLVHELGHAAIHLDGTDDRVAIGHGQAWMSKMISIGYESEARRIAGIIPGAAEAFALAMNSRSYDGNQAGIRGQEPVRPVYSTPKRQICHYQPVNYQFANARGVVFLQTVWTQVCVNQQ